MAESETVLEHHFRDLQQQREVSELGMWIFLMTEVLLFGVLFTSYTVFRHSYPAGFAAGSRDMETTIGAVNTAVLLISSFFIALSVYGAQTGGRKKLLWGLAIGALLGVVFMILKGVEYYDHYQHREVPGILFDYAKPNAHGVEIFFYLYFVMTGIHAIHLTIGICIVVVILVAAYRGRYSPLYHNPVEIVGLYWHFVDIVWIFLFPLLYLIDLKR
ncbi:MAG TPA: cytochrome c oxidase subunit 3 family protein [Blastocatellia bacterium]|nr:cytochrome c oxidase subunit 3 family protein [Blastocatellia bacterium]